MKLALTIILSFCLNFAFSQNQTLSGRISRDSIEINQLRKELEQVKKTIDLNNTLVTNGHSLIANELSASTRSLNIFTIILSVILVIGGILLTRMESSTRKIGEQTSQKLLEINAIEASIQKIDSNITNSLSKLYKDLQNEEINNLLDKIESDPTQLGMFTGKISAHTFSTKQFERIRRFSNSIKSTEGLEAQYNTLRQILDSKSPKTTV